MDKNKKSKTWVKTNELADFWGLWILRSINAFIFVSFVIYIGQWILGIDILGIITLFGTMVSSYYKSEKNFVLIISKKIMTLGWGLSSIFFMSAVATLWSMRDSYSGQIKVKLKSLYL